MAPKTKALKLKRALKLGKNRGTPLAGEDPIVLLRVQILGCKDLLAKDRGGTSDPFINISLLTARFQTPVIKKTLAPTWADGTATYNIPLFLSVAHELGVLELVVWDKDLLKKDYLGEAGISLEDWFGPDSTRSRALGFDDQGNMPFSLPLQSSRPGTTASGTITLKLGFVQAPGTNNLLELDEIYSELVRRARPSLVSAPPTEGVGTVRSSHYVPYEDDGGISSDSDSDYSNEEEDEDEDEEEFVDAMQTPPKTPGTPAAAPDVEITPASPSSLTQTPNTPTPAMRPSPTPRSPSFMRLKFPRRNTGNSGTSSPTSTVDEDQPKEDVKEKKKRFRKSFPSPVSVGRKRKGKEFKLPGPNDIVGIVMLEIKSAEDLPKLSNMTRTGWDMDPFVVISFGKKVFRTRVIRHSLNPVWDERLLFHVRKHETTFGLHFTVSDWDKLSSNDYIGDSSFSVQELLEDAEKCDEETGLYPISSNPETLSDKMKEFKLDISTGKESVWAKRHKPVLTVRAKYQPYDALRQKFWQKYLTQYDTDDTGCVSHLELTSMLDSLGSTLTKTTVDAFWSTYGKNPATDELTIPEAIQCLEAELMRPDSEKRTIAENETGMDTSVSATPVLSVSGSRGEELPLQGLDFSGPPMTARAGVGAGEGADVVPPPPVPTEPAQVPLDRRNPSYSSSSDADLDEDVQTTVTRKRMSRFKKKGKKGTASSGGSSGGNSGSGSSPPSSESSVDPVERVINVKNCPMCHRPRMSSKAEVDIVTHLAVCASSDWSKVGEIVVGNFVTASQAQRKWYGRLVGKISGGDYKLGANSGNIIVQNRMTGMLEEEKMQVYVRMGIRLLYKGAKGRMEGGRAKKLLKSMSIKQGVKYDDPASAKDIPAFLNFHSLNVDEILDPLDSFKTFNEFFYRKLKPTARPLDSPGNESRIVSSADCRLMVFPTVTDATRLWIKGREFTVAKLLGCENETGPGAKYAKDISKYHDGAVAIFRLAPQDYHRFHCPVAGTIGEMTDIAGEYYTVNPQAIRTALDVYGENVRKIVPIDSPVFGRVMAVCVGAMMVGTIRTTVEEGQEVQRGQEFGYFAFGGSTIVMLFEKGRVEWDEDLVVNSRASLETLVRVGMGIGNAK
ncbi:hypothetical protein CYLTODRAFT_421485 [Cylindrobasidium torrendii FP15055 ss-10]|uniref:Phosphatidylserine decarboxylase proenzyme 2 n=1 Tax=Cylindrobasidium torrendii FP15055 ss-10 TaxID=1314674 RepID=A0A0D7BDF4_9AGAR|nr:hypothetical protein CYLTODRAFT_421485 [Cylindrobasidium torrendii FP15055 ss-10]